MRKPKYSFEQWCLDNDRQDLLDRWDYEKTGYTPEEIGIYSERSIWFTCPNGLHESEPHTIPYLKDHKKAIVKCRKCNSFAQAIIDEFGEDYLDFVWSSRNISSPWDFAKTSLLNAFFNCENNNSHVYEIQLDHFVVGQRCPYCAKKRILTEDSLGYLFPHSVKCWSDKNEKTPFDYFPGSAQYVWWKCPDEIHEDFYRIIENSVRYDFRCPDCTSEALVETGANNRNDLTGMTFKNLVVTGYAFTKENRAYWFCDCSCGKKNIPRLGYGLLHGHITSCGDKSFHYKGENAPYWKGGVTSERRLIRSSSSYSNWRLNVFKKCFYECQICFSKDIEAHHIEPFSTNEELRLDECNGIALCKEHHRTKKDSYHSLYKGIECAKTLEEYINIKRKEIGIFIPFNIDDFIEGYVLNSNTIRELNNIYTRLWFIPVRDCNANGVSSNKFAKIFPRYRIRHD